MELPENSGGTFEPCPQGTFIARCYRFIDLGSHEQTYQGQSKGKRRLVLLSFEIPTELMSDGRPFTISKRYTWSVHEKSSLRHDLESWRGKKFQDSDFGKGGFDIRNVLGKACTITVQHSEKDGNVYANIAAIGSPMKGVDIAPQVNPDVYVALAKDRFEQKDFDTLSDKLKSKIMASPEWAVLNGKVPEYTEANPPPFNDDIPF